jgi:hypothetical protein
MALRWRNQTTLAWTESANLRERCAREPLLSYRFEPVGEPLDQVKQ